ncbi:MAG: DegT/DnrJ/EryC1/StrS family aminotransferase [Verrucomicrobia bacterium]|nr:DegT/DnrJ/EryC1/StrS family aminotransferase [Verrucomicrobiota bacterium]
MAKLAISGGKPVRKHADTPWPARGRREADAVARVALSGTWSFNGPNELEFAERWAAYQDAKYGLLVANGSVAITVAMQALGIRPDEEVIVPPLTWYATASAPLALGIIPVFVDVDPASFCIDPGAVEAAITPRTRAVIPVHLFGSCADLDRLRRICRKHDLFLVEDCAHAHGAKWRGKGVGSHGDFGTFSFQQSKLLTAGEGGAVLTNSRRNWLLAYSFKNCGRLWHDTGGEHVFGTNLRITEFQAAILLEQLRRLRAQNARRDRNRRVLDELLGTIDGIAPQQRPKQVTFQAPYIYAFRYTRSAFGGLPRKSFIEALRAEGVGAFSIYDEPVPHGALWPEQHWSFPLRQGHLRAKICYARQHLPIAERLCHDELVGLWHTDLLGTQRDMRDIARAIRKIQDNVRELL